VFRGDARVCPVTSTLLGRPLKSHSRTAPPQLPFCTMNRPLPRGALPCKLCTSLSYMQPCSCWFIYVYAMCHWLQLHVAPCTTHCLSHHGAISAFHFRSQLASSIARAFSPCWHPSNFHFALGFGVHWACLDVQWSANCACRPSRLCEYLHCVASLQHHVAPTIQFFLLQHPSEPARIDNIPNFSSHPAAVSVNCQHPLQLFNRTL
jgi:hypothetical protein